MCKAYAKSISSEASRPVRAVGNIGIRALGELFHYDLQRLPYHLREKYRESIRPEDAVFAESDSWLWVLRVAEGATVSEGTPEHEQKLDSEALDPSVTKTTIP